MMIMNSMSYCISAGINNDDSTFCSYTDCGHIDSSIARLISIDNGRDTHPHRRIKLINSVVMTLKENCLS